MKYNVHFNGYYAYDIEVEAEDRETAREKAQVLFEDVPLEEYVFECEPESVWEIKQDVALAREVSFRETMDGPVAP